METDLTTLVPPRRLGALLRQARVAAGLELDELANHSELTVVELDDLEQGRRIVDDQLLGELVRIYGVEDVGLMPERSQLVIDLDEGRISVTRSDIGMDEASGPDAVLTRYLALVYRLRELPIGTPIGLRDVDLEVLSKSLEIETAEVASRLKRLMVDEDEVARDQKRIRRRLLLPLVGVVIAASSTGILVLVAENEPAPDPSTSATADVSTAATQTAVGSARVATGAVAQADVVATDLGNGAAVVENSATD